MIPEIKICGITRSDEINFLNRTPIAYIGFVFAVSKRQVTPEQACKLSEGLRDGIKKVGVFTDRSLAEINWIAETCHLDIIQIHGAYTDFEIKTLSRPVWKAITMKSPECVRQSKDYPSAKAFVLDTYNPVQKGGTGKVFHWEWAEGFSAHDQVVLAGGLNAGNVHKAIQIVKPHIIDVSSGVEGPSGKEEKRVIEFIKAVKKDEQ